MTTLTKLPYDEKYITEYSEKHNEPAWMKEFRLEALELANNLELPKPNKTNIRRWNFTEFKHQEDGEKINSLEEAPEEIKDFIDTENENVIIYVIKQLLTLLSVKN